MYDYARLPTLVLNEIFGYLNVKERVKAKSVCRAWKEEIELREQKCDTLVLHIGPYRWNIRWNQTNNQGLMRFENSFQMKRLTFLGHPMTQLLLKKIKKLAIVDFKVDAFNQTISSFQPYLGYFDQCVEIEIRCSRPERKLTFDLPKLKVLVIIDGPVDRIGINSSPVDKLVLNCPSLETLFWNWKVKEISFETPKNLKRLICNGWPATVSLNGKFLSLEYVNIFVAKNEPVSDHLLDRMPKLKRLVLYSNNLQADLEIIREQQKRVGLKNLEVLFNGFRDPIEIHIDTEIPMLYLSDWSIEQLHANYSELVENSPWRVCIDYSQLFRKFKILPSNFFERFSEVFAIGISEVTSHTHLFGFLKCYPYVERMRIHFSKMKADQVMDLLHLLQPSLTELIIVEERPPDDVLKIDLSFMLLSNLAQLSLVSTRLPVEFLRRVAAKRDSRLNVFNFAEIEFRHKMLIAFSPKGVFLIDVTCGAVSPRCPSVEALIAHMQSDKHLSTFLF